MKKGIKESKVQRMRNLVTGNYTANTKVISGYTPEIIERKEGDIWKEKGKTWTIKNGIKRTFTKLDKARKMLHVPLTCPKCEKKMNHPAHKQMYNRWGMCLVCVTTWEHKMKLDGTYDEWHKQFDEQNFNAFIKDVQQEYEEWLNSRNAQHYITESGDIEDWSGGKSNEELAEDFKQEIQKVQEKRNESKQNTTNN